MNPSRLLGIEATHSRAKLGAVLGTAAIYLAAFPALYEIVGDSLLILVSVPALLAAWSFGARAGVLASALAFLLNVVLVIAVGESLGTWLGQGGVLGALALLAAAVLAGCLRDLGKQSKRELTELKRTKEALAYQARLVDDVSDAIIASDERFVTTAWNRAAEKMYGWTVEEVIGKPTTEFLQPEFVDVDPDEVFRRLLEEGHFEGEVIHPRKDGTRIHVEARATALRDKDGRITGFVSIDRDITERKRAEATISELNGELEKRIRERLNRR